MTAHNNLEQLEQVALNAWPGLKTYLHAGMVVRSANGYTKRANSATVLFNAQWTLEKQQWVENFYQQSNRPAIFRLLSFNEPVQFDEQLASRGYTKIDLTDVMTLQLSKQPAPSDPNCRLLPLDFWLEIFHAFDRSKLGEEQKSLHKNLLLQVPGQLCPMVLNVDGRPVACGLGVLDQSYFGIFDIITDEGQRRKGYGGKLVRNLCNWGQNQQATKAFLQVMSTNQNAVRLYRKLGFSAEYHYWYRLK